MSVQASKHDDRASDDPTMIVAGRLVPLPVQRILRYVELLPATLRRYDLAGVGDCRRVSHDEVVRTRVIRSRVSDDERDWFVLRAAEGEQLLSTVPVDAVLRDADPGVHGGLFDQALALYQHFEIPRRPRVSDGKISKLLHLKRPHLYPILDSRLRNAYQRAALAAAARYRHQRPGLRRSYWAAVRDDLIMPANVRGLAVIRERLRHHPDQLTQHVANLSDVRLLDILTWQPAVQDV
ncbi:DUF6308 family protein [Micromonospora echinaurantiaca]|uniref:DUF6308 family protein n=1 Tax=Micromonospora echinaurantiaca TaxID=47857 RepID=UPI00379282A3